MVATLISVLLLGFLVIVHEVGHLLVARASGVRILRFSVGFGPRLFAWRRGHTEYVVSAIPLGGYVKMAGEQHTDAAEPWEYFAKPIGVRARIVFAGPLVNYLVSLASLWVVFLIGYPELLPVVGKVMDRMPAQAAGLKSGDRIQAIDGRVTRTWDEMMEVIQESAERPRTFQIDRGGVPQTVTITPKAQPGTDFFGRNRAVGRIGIAASGAFQTSRVGPLAALGRTLAEQSKWAGKTLLGFWYLLTGQLSMRESVTGPIGIMVITSEAVRMGVSPVLLLISLFSLSLAIFNLIPIPILDGGHLFFLALEKLRGRPVSLNIQERAVQVSFVLLMALVVTVCINDISRFELLKKLGGLVGR